MNVRERQRRVAAIADAAAVDSGEIAQLVEAQVALGHTGRTQEPIPPAAPPSDQPSPELVRGVCPDCGAPVVSTLHYFHDRGYLIAWQCWRALQGESNCSYRKVL